ncbi:MAG: DUF177 domain-containing protein, partial [Rikenellaceae bacterium]
PFFDFFDNEEVINADFNVDIAITKGLGATKIDISINGTITVPCDRCLADAEFPIEYETTLYIKQSDSVKESYWDNDGDDEIIWINAQAGEVDLRQYLYDTIMLSLPLQRIHEDGECDAEVIKNITYTE